MPILKLRALDEGDRWLANLDRLIELPIEFLGSLNPLFDQISRRVMLEEAR